MKKAPISYDIFHDLYAFLFLVNFLGLLFFGIYPGIKALGKKNQFLKELSTKNEEFTTLLETANRKEELYEEVRPYLGSLESSIPDEYYGSRIISDFLILTAKHRYFLTEISLRSREGNYTNATITLEGAFENLEDFLDDLENSEIGLIVTNISVTLDEEEDRSEDNLKLEFKLYNSGRGET